MGPFSEGETQCVLVMSNILVERVIGCDSSTHNYQYAQVYLSIYLSIYLHVYLSVYFRSTHTVAVANVS